MDFLDSLKEIKGQMVKEQKAVSEALKPKPNPNKDEFKDIFDSQSNEDKENRLKDEFMEFIKHSDVRKLD